MLVINLKKKLKNFFLNISLKTSFKKIGIFGHSGSGKSLSLALISGFLTPDDGFIKIEDKVFFSKVHGINLPPSERKVGYVFQDYLLFPHMTVLENLRFVCKDIQRIYEFAEIFEIKHILNKYPSQISGGQKQRVSILRAILFNPKILLLDEPFSALNEALREKLLYFFKDILEKYNLPFLFVSHNFEEVYLLCDYIIFLENGKIIFESEKEKLFDNLNIKAAKALNFPFVVKKGNKYFSLKKDFIFGKVNFKNKNKFFLEGEILEIYKFPEYISVKIKVKTTSFEILDFELKPLKEIFLKFKNLDENMLKNKILQVSIPENALISLKS